MQEHFMDMDSVQELLRMARTGLWTIELEEGREPRMYGDKACLLYTSLSAARPGTMGCSPRPYSAYPAQRFPLTCIR